MKAGYFTSREPLMLRAVATSQSPAEIPSPPASETYDFCDLDLLAQIRLLASDRRLRDAVAVSSPSLDKTLERLLEGAELPRKRLMKMAVSLTKYALRIAGRPTPFGLHAGVSVLETAGTARVEHTERRVRARFDEAWFSEVARTLLTYSSVRHALNVVVTNLGYVRGDRLVLPSTKAPDGTGEKGSGQASIRMTPLLATVRETAAKPIRYAELVDRLADTLLDTPAEQVDRYLLGLVQNGVLLTSLRSDLLDELPHDGTCPESDTMRELRTRLRRYEERPDSAEGIEDLRAASRTAKGLAETTKGAIQVDLDLGIRAAVPPGVLAEIESYASSMWRITPDEPSHPHMVSYFYAFMDRYGKYGAVRLEQLIDSHRGLGFPTGYRHPLVNSRVFPDVTGTKDELRQARREEHVAVLLHSGLTHPDGEVVLDESDMELLADSTQAPPYDMDLCFQLRARDTDALNAGDFELVSSPLVGARVMGATMGRFAELTGSVDRLAALYPSGHSSGIHAQVFFEPTSTRARNVMRTPRLVPFTLPIGTFVDREDGGRPIDWRELVVHSDGTRLRLHWPREDTEVHPFVPHMLALQGGAPNLARFLSELRYTSGRKAWREWNWKGYDALPMLPRVRIGKVVAFPKTWRATPALRQAAGDPSAWHEAVPRWREASRVDRRVGVVDQDRVYALDLDDAFHREILRRDLLKGGVTLMEGPGTGEEDFGWLQGRSNEIVVPLRGRAGTDDPRPPHPPAVIEPVHHDLGGDWAYVRLYADLDTHDELIARHLPQVIREMADLADQWFFIRFNDPEPHIRLRLHSADARTTGRMHERLHENLRALVRKGLLRRVSAESYEPETERYGGPEALSLVERIFCVDSQVAVNQIRLLNRGQALDVAANTVLVADYASLLEALGVDWTTWAAERFMKSRDGAVGRDQIDEVCRIVTAKDVARSVTERLPALDLVRAWGDNAAARGYGESISRDRSRFSEKQQNYAISSLLHMQHNRLVGVNPENEERSLILLGHAARRLRHR